jgi:EAL domain-containing protein (putative c-di-GMP-specific phosphodiesterase class I)
LWAQGIASNQPKRHDEGLHLELLCRLRDTNGHILTPETFMPVVAAENLERLLDQRVIEKAFGWFETHRHALNHIDRVSINVSGSSVSDPGFADYVHQALERHGLAAHQFCFEITETALIQNFDVARQWVDSVRRLGFRVVLDDFGTGVATFDYLKRLPVDGVKIDGVFIRQIHQSPLDEQIVAAVVAIARSLGKYTVAEFVSDARILEKVVALGVDYSQGWALGRAEPIEMLLADPAKTQHHFSRTGAIERSLDSTVN